MSVIAISAITRKRRELTGEMMDLLERYDELAKAVATLDGAARLLDPKADLEAVPSLRCRPKPDWAIRGQVSRKVFDLLRGAPEPMSTTELTAKVHGDAFTRVHVKRVRKCLERQRDRATIEGITIGGVLCWRLVAV
jgi:hypothetical protein